MKQQVHILNGDALKNQFPSSIKGETLIMRECLVEGPLEGTDFNSFINTRAQYLSETYQTETSFYYENVITQFTKMIAIPATFEINVWFEDDLFCQTNLWFILNLLYERDINTPIYLVRPELHTRYGFGGLNTSELTMLYHKKRVLKPLKDFADLWTAYKINDLEKLLEIATRLRVKFPFVYSAVEAHMLRLATKNSLGLPKETLLEIIKEFNTNDFGFIYSEFQKRLPIYGFGDLQVKRLYEDLTKRRL